MVKRKEAAYLFIVLLQVCVQTWGQMAIACLNFVHVHCDANQTKACLNSIENTATDRGSGKHGKHGKHEQHLHS